MLKVELKGFDTIIKGLKKSPEVAVKELGIALGKSLIITQRQAMREAPGDTGILRQNIKKKRINKLGFEKKP